MPTRRSFLGAVPTATLLPLGGCLSAPGNSASPGLSLATIDDQPDAPLEVDVAVTRERATEGHPPGLRVSVTNTADESVDVGEARAVVFAYQYSRDGSLVLLPTGREYPAEAGCWRLTEGIAVSEEYRVRTLAPGETMASALSLYATTELPEGACLPVGEYRFESRYTLNPDTEERRFTWGFSVALRE